MQPSDELPIKLGPYFSRRQTPSIYHTVVGGGLRLGNRQRSSDNFRALFSIFSGYHAWCEQSYHMDARHFVIIECRHMAKGCALKCGCIGLMLFRNLLMSGHNTK